MTQTEALQCVTMLAGAFPRPVMSEATVSIYVQFLLPHTVGAVQLAIRRLILTTKFLPTISEIAAIAAEEGLPRVLDPAVAWSEAVGLMSAIGSYRSLGAAGSPYVNRTLRLCGRWDEICQEDATWLRKRFVEIYAGVVREVREAMQVTGTLPDWLEGPTPHRSIAGQVQSLIDDLTQATTVPRCAA